MHDGVVLWMTTLVVMAVQAIAIAGWQASN
jgi:hypothetical protein